VCVSVCVCVHLHVLCAFPSSTFINNTGIDGIVNVAYAPTRFLGTNIFMGNKGTPLRVRVHAEHCVYALPVHTPKCTQVEFT